MKHSLLRLTLLLSLIGVMASVSVYGLDTKRLRVNIPFQFTVGVKVLDPGVYIIASVPNFRGVYEVRSADGTQSVLAITKSIPNTARNSKPALVFHRYADQNFLAQVWISDGYDGIELTQSASERQAAKSGQSLQLVSLHVSGRFNEN